MSLLALDVGFAKMGWCIFIGGEPIEWGIIKTAKTKKKMVRVADDNASRAAYVAKELAEILDTFEVEGVVAEIPHGGAQSAKAMAFMASATALVSAVLSILDVPVEYVTPSEVKKAICGKLSASKDEMMEGVRNRYSHISFPTTKAQFEDVADAIGAYIAARDGNLVKLFG